MYTNRLRTTTSDLAEIFKIQALQYVWYIFYNLSNSAFTYI